MSLETSVVSTSLEAIRAQLAHAKLSASTMNFIVWIDDPARRDWILERAAMLSEKHPSFTLVLDHSGTREGDATVTTTKRDGELQFTVQGERVEIDVDDADVATIAGYVTGLSQTGVPTILWWSGMREASRPIFEALLPLIDTLVVDSSGGNPDDTAIRKLVAFHATGPAVVLRDLAWMRLHPWQLMIADLFEDPNLRSELYSIRRLHIRSGSDSEAFYLAGWLASSLGWTATGRDAFTDGEGNIVRFERVRDGEPRRIRAICLDSVTSWYHGELTEDPNVVSVWVEGDYARPPHLFPLQAIDNASLLERAILEPGRDDVFETALRSVATLLGDG
jgi:hypothetical protein